MAIIYSYQENEDLLASDRLIGTATTFHNGKSRKVTKNFSLGQLKEFISNGDLVLTTLGTSGPAELVDNNLNIPIYSDHSPYTFVAPLVNTYNTITINQSSGSTNGYLSSTDWTTFNSKQGTITLTTTGTSGAATFVGNVLNIPQYSGSTVIPTLNEVLTAGNTSVISANIGELGIWDPTNTAYAKISSDDNILFIKDAAANSLFSINQGSFAVNKNNSINAKISTVNLTSSRTFYFPDATGTIALLTSLSSAATGLTYTNTTGVFSLTSGYSIPTTASQSNWDTAYTNRITSLTTTGTGAATLVANVLNIPTPPTATFTSLTTTGSSGSSTLAAGVLNVPTYTLAGLGGQAALSGIGVVKSTAGTISYINGTTAQYIRGDGSLATFPTIPTVGTWGTLNYPTWTSGTPFVKMTAAGTFALDTNTYLTSAVTSVSATSPITSSGGNTPTISTSMATNKLIGRSTAGTGVMEEISVGSGLTLSAGILSASGGGTVTSVAALTLGTTGTDLSSTVANPTTTPVITLNVPTASATNRGALSSADWTTFNNKQNAIGYTPLSSADNGLTLSGTVAKLGGALLQATTIDGGSSSAYNLTFTNGDFIVSNGSGIGGARGNIILSNNRSVYWGSTSGNYIGADSSVGGFTYYAPPSTGKHVFYSSVKFANYGAGAKTGTTAYNLSVTSVGDIIETSPLALTTTGTSGPATLVGSTLNIPQYSGGGGGSTPVKLTSQTLVAGSWALVGSYYTYAFSNVNVTTTCDVSVTPQNASYLAAYNAQVLPFVGVAAGVATFYSQFPPQEDIVVDIVITQTT